MRRGLLITLFGVGSSLVLLAAGRLETPNAWTAVHAPTPAQTQSFGTGTTAVIVDVVVRDKRHNPITDLTRADFELAEDGVRQDVAEMQLVAPPAGTGGANAGSRAGRSTGSTDAASPSGGAGPTFVALVFDELTTEGRHYAYKAAQAYLETQHENDFAGVFQTGASFATVATYTNDRKAIAAALHKVANRASTPLLDPSKATAPGEAVAPAGGGPRPAQGGGFVPAAAIGAGLQEKAQQIWEVERFERGYATADALRAIVGALGTLPGRKTVVFFADQLSMPEEVMPAFAGMNAAASQANVAIYTVDVAGLRAVSKESESAKVVNQVGQNALTLDNLGSSQNSLRAMEGMERTLRENPRVSLSLLSRDTGGFLIDNTNDLAGGFRRIEADRRFHYLLTYTPRNAEFNGEWRSISVRIPSRPGLVIRARSGYIAVRSPGAIPLLTYEGRAAVALDRQPPPSELPVRAAALVFPRPDGGSHVAILAETAASALTFEDSGDHYRSDFTLLARVRDAHGEVVRKASRPYRLSGPIAEKAGVQAGRVLFFRQPTLPPGQYTLDVAVDDGLSRKAAVVHVPVAVPAASERPRVSSLVLVARAERVPASPRAGEDDNELTVGEVQLYPNLGEPYRAADNLSFYASIIAGGASIGATLGLARGDVTLATQPLTLPAPDASGRIRVMGQLSLSALGPGSFTLTLTVTGGPGPVVRSVPFSVLR